MDIQKNVFEKKRMCSTLNKLLVTRKPPNIYVNVNVLIPQTMTNSVFFDFVFATKYHIIYTEKHQNLYLVNELTYHLNILEMHLLVFLGFPDLTKFNFWKKKCKNKIEKNHSKLPPLSFILPSVVITSTHKQTQIYHGLFYFMLKINITKL